MVHYRSAVYRVAYYQRYVDGSWRFYAASEGRNFITSDHPSHSFIHGPEPEFRDHGYFFMPISSQLFLWGMFGDAREESGLASPRIEWDSDEMDRQNQWMYDKSSRFIYSASELELKRMLGQKT